MNNTSKTKSSTLAGRYLEKMEKMHPHQVILLFALVGSSIIFIFLLGFFSLSYFTLGKQVIIDIPKFFVISTLIMLSSSFIMHQALAAFKNEDFVKYRRIIGTVLLMGFLFTCAQYFGWKEMYNNGVRLEGYPAGAFLYVITALHFLHMLGAMIFLTHLFKKAQIMVKDPVKRLIMQTTPYEHVKIRMATIAWHFLDAMWILLFLYFLLSF